MKFLKWKKIHTKYCVAKNIKKCLTHIEHCDIILFVAHEENNFEREMKEFRKNISKKFLTNFKSVI